jgi:predicted trehalose synthase
MEEQLHQEHLELMGSFGQLQEQMATWEANKKAERIEHARQIDEMKKAREADLQALRQELLSMMQAAHGHTAFQQVLVKLVIE